MGRPTKQYVAVRKILEECGEEWTGKKRIDSLLKHLKNGALVGIIKDGAYFFWPEHNIGFDEATEFILGYIWESKQSMTQVTPEEAQYIIKTWRKE